MDRASSPGCVYQVQLKPALPIISIRQLRVDYGSFTAVHDLSLEIPKGAIFGLVGPNGAGKTSTIKVLATLMEPTYGEVIVANKDVEKEVSGVRQVLGYMPDLAPVITNLTVFQFLDHFARSYGLDDAAERRSRIEHCLHQVKLSDSAKVFCGTLSRGMTQRVVLAKTLLHDPDVYLLDEPASGMDPMARLDLRDLLRDLSKAGKTVLISSHILTELAEMCTDIGLIHKGRLNIAGPVEKVLESVDTRHRVISIQCLGAKEPLLEFLTTDERIGDVVTTEQTVEVAFTGSVEEQVNLLKTMIDSGFPIHAFQPKKAGLEDLLRKVSSEG